VKEHWLCGLVERRIDEIDEMSEISATDPAEIAAAKDVDHSRVSSSFIMPTIDLSSPGSEFNLPSHPGSALASKPDLFFPAYVSILGCYLRV